jgi:hypothetical protein
MPYANWEDTLACGRRWYKRNRETEIQRMKNYRKRPDSYLKSSAYRKIKAAHNQEYGTRPYVRVILNAKASKHRAQKIRTSKFELNSDGNILKLFKLSNKKTKETGRDYHIDHIVPLQGRLVSGFHVAGNLRVILAETNLSKKNHYTARDEALIQRRMIKTWIANGVDFKLYKPKKRRKAS